jgi:hypothetical protein
MAQPEPCMKMQQGDTFCRSPIACNAFGYCRNRNILFGIPDESTAEQWKKEAVKAKKKQAILNKQESIP